MSRPPSVASIKKYPASVAESEYPESTTDTAIPEHHVPFKSVVEKPAEDDTTSVASHKSLDFDFIDYNSNDIAHPTRVDLNKALGEDMGPHTTEITTFPCAGIRISQGPLASLIGWRFVVRPDEPNSAFRAANTNAKQAVVVNFLLDTGLRKSVIPLETFRAMNIAGGTEGVMPKVGSDVMLTVQGLRTKMTVGRPGEMGRLSGQFMFSGDLTLYFDPRLDAPVLYVTDIEMRTVLKPLEIPRTVARTFSCRVLSMFAPRQKSPARHQHRHGHHQSHQSHQSHHRKEDRDHQSDKEK